MTQQVIDLLDVASGAIDQARMLIEAEMPEEPGDVPVSAFEYGGMLSSAGGAVVNVTAGSRVSDADPRASISITAGTIDLSTNGVGGLDTGSISASTTYHFFSISGSAGSEKIASASLSPSLPTGYTAKRRLLSVPTNASGALPNFSQMGDSVVCDPVGFVPFSNPGTASMLKPTGAPQGIQVDVRLTVAMYNATATVRSLLVSSPSQPDLAPSGSLFTLRSSDSANNRQSTEVVRRTDVLGNVRFRAETSDANMSVFYSMIGWSDPGIWRCL